MKYCNNYSLFALSFSGGFRDILSRADKLWACPGVIRERVANERAKKSYQAVFSGLSVGTTRA